ncbi:hypothetical protein [Nocardioides marmoribigeumensis]|uniref:SnoaL-like domain-containing protein n=1 Tax=Nocardioides marmoribigeumensis TaxID=433649 RepID=A0ABU2BPN5_9ACTN|nr:hypothetical protein [Nocardioides marmoribigeumensis]MDR7360602.1 hypothetical protein [Nocardioides marmoribigeumensis]
MTLPRPLATSSRLLGSVAVVAALTVVLLAVARLTTGGDAAASPPGASTTAARVPAPSWPEPGSLRAVRVLEQWQAARERAWAVGDLAGLRRLYLPGSEAGRRDAALLAAYLARGLRVELRTRSDRLAVLVSRPRRVVVRQHAAVRLLAHLSGRTRALPASGASRELELVRVGRTWRLRSARPGSPREPP